MSSKRSELQRVIKIHFLESLGERDGQGWACYYCKRPLRSYGDNNYADSPAIEHKNPIARGGSNDMNNLVLACAECNRMKGTKIDEEFKAIRLPFNEWLNERLIKICNDLDPIVRDAFKSHGYQVDNWQPLLESIREMHGDDWPMPIVNDAIEKGRMPKYLIDSERSPRLFGK